MATQEPCRGNNDGERQVRLEFEANPRNGMAGGSAWSLSVFIVRKFTVVFVSGMLAGRRG